MPSLGGNLCWNVCFTLVTFVFTGPLLKAQAFQLYSQSKQKSSKKVGFAPYLFEVQLYFTLAENVLYDFRFLPEIKVITHI